MYGLAMSAGRVLPGQLSQTRLREGKNSLCIDHKESLNKGFHNYCLQLNHSQIEGSGIVGAHIAVVDPDHSQRIHLGETRYLLLGTYLLKDMARMMHQKGTFQPLQDLDIVSYL